jgi:hypothetical protein
MIDLMQHLRRSISPRSAQPESDRLPLPGLVGGAKRFAAILCAPSLIGQAIRS